MMGKSKELSVDLRNLIVEKHFDGNGYRRISRMLNVPVSTVGAIIRKWKEHQFTINRPRSGAPRKIPVRGVQRIIRRVLQEPRTTRAELQEDLASAGTACFKENYKQCTEPPWHPCTLTTQDSIAEQKAC